MSTTEVVFVGHLQRTALRAAAEVALLVGVGALLASPVWAQDLLRAEGGTLAAFDVVVNLAAIDHATALGLAESFSQFQRDEQAVGRQFARRFREAHLELLGRFYDPGLVKRQQMAYDAAREPVSEYASEVLTVEEGEAPPDNPAGAGAVAMIRRTWRDAEGKAVARMLRLRMEKRGEFWWVEGVDHEEEGKGFVPSGFGAPPVAPPVPIAAEVPEDLATPEATLRALDLAARRLAAQRERAHRALYRHFEKIVGAFYGPEAEARVAKERPQPEPAPVRTFEVGSPEKRLAGLVRIEVTAYEVVPGTSGAKSPVGQTAFDFRRGDDGAWHVVGELIRPKPAEPLVPRSEGLALFLLLPSGR